MCTCTPVSYTHLCAQLQAGEVGYLTASIKTVQDTRVGDTVTLANNCLLYTSRCV